jgi:hypothetical protein
MSVSRGGILVENHGSIILLGAASPWVEENVDRGEYQPLPAGMRIVEPRYLQPIIDGARGAGLVVK